MATSIKIDDELKARHRLWQSSGNCSAHWIMREAALLNNVGRKRPRSFKQRSFELMVCLSGKRVEHLTGEEVRKTG